MLFFTIGLLLAVISCVFIWQRRKMLPGHVTKSALAGAVVAGAVGIIVGLIITFLSTGIKVEEGEGGLVIRKMLGGSMGEGEIIARNNENGPQAEVLAPGWHFWYWPWDYDLEHVQDIAVPEGSVGVVTAKDGIPLSEGQVFADLWDDPKKMLDGQHFLTDGKGYAGPQLTVLPPANYRYNPRLFAIDIHPALTVKVGQVAIIKANAGKTYTEKTEVVNGVPIVPKGYRGIWLEALTPNMYYLHPNAYEIIFVKTVNRIYSYTGPSRLSGLDRPEDDNSINVRTKDGFEFPVDVRASAKISAEDAPYVVALLGDPDADANGDGFDTLEEIVILPAVRAIFRNSAEQRGALEYVGTRSEIEQTSSKVYAEKLKEFKVNTDGLFVADIGLSKTEEGKKLLLTQTEKETANQEKETWTAKKEAQLKRAESVKAETEADMEADKAKAEIAKIVKLAEGEAENNMAIGKAKAATAMIEAVGGFDNYLTLEVAKMVVERWEGQIPQVLVTGGESGAGLDAALIAKMIQQMTEQSKGDPRPIADKDPLNDIVRGLKNSPEKLQQK